MFSLLTTTNQKKSGALRRMPAFMAALMFGVVWQANFASATIDNTATASGTYGAATVISNSNTVHVAVVLPISTMQVTKTANPTSNLSAGQVITYTYNVKNTGNVTIKNISLSEVHNAAGPAPVPGSETVSIDAPPLNDSNDATASDGVWSNLAPGDNITFTATYTVQQSDVDQRQ